MILVSGNSTNSQGSSATNLNQKNDNPWAIVGGAVGGLGFLVIAVCFFRKIRFQHLVVNRSTDLMKDV